MLLTPSERQLLRHYRDLDRLGHPEARTWLARQAVPVLLAKLAAAESELAARGEAVPAAIRSRWEERG